MMTKDELDQWFSFLGYGHLEAPVWFVGIEPGGDQTSCGPQSECMRKWNDQHEIRWSPRPREEAPDGRLFTLAWKRPIEILQLASDHEHSPKEDWSWAWRNMMTANLAPLPRKGIKEKINGIYDEKEYHTKVWGKRVRMLRDIFVDHKSLRVMIIHGKNAWTRYKVKEIFSDTGDWTHNPEPPFMHVLVRNNKRLLLTKSMTWYKYFTNADCKTLAEMLKDWRNKDKDWPDF
jgi:hypothetical protein